jgi:hypothetical protein
MEVGSGRVRLGGLYKPGGCWAKWVASGWANWPNRARPRGMLSPKKNFIKIIIKNSK